MCPCPYRVTSSETSATRTPGSLRCSLSHPVSTRTSGCAYFSAMALPPTVRFHRLCAPSCSWCLRVHPTARHRTAPRAARKSDWLTDDFGEECGGERHPPRAKVSLTPAQDRCIDEEDVGCARSLPSQHILDFPSNIN